MCTAVESAVSPRRGRACARGGRRGRPAPRIPVPRGFPGVAPRRARCGLPRSTQDSVRSGTTLKHEVMVVAVVRALLVGDHPKAKTIRTDPSSTQLRGGRGTVGTVNDGTVVRQRAAALQPHRGLRCPYGQGFAGMCLCRTASPRSSWAASRRRPPPRPSRDTARWGYGRPRDAAVPSVDVTNEDRSEGLLGGVGRPALDLIEVLVDRAGVFRPQDVRSHSCSHGGVASHPTEVRHRRGHGNCMGVSWDAGLGWRVSAQLLGMRRASLHPRPLSRDPIVDGGLRGRRANTRKAARHRGWQRRAPPQRRVGP